MSSSLCVLFIDSNTALSAKTGSSVAACKYLLSAAIAGDELIDLVDAGEGDKTRCSICTDAETAAGTTDETAFLVVAPQAADGVFT
jgi:hypothetical protein